MCEMWGGAGMKDNILQEVWDNGEIEERVEAGGYERCCQIFRVNVSFLWDEVSGEICNISTVMQKYTQKWNT